MSYVCHRSTDAISGTCNSKPIYFIISFWVSKYHSLQATNVEIVSPLPKNIRERFPESKSPGSFLFMRCKFKVPSISRTSPNVLILHSKVSVAAAVAEQPEEEETVPLSLSGILRVLIVDDQSVMRQVAANNQLVNGKQINKYN